MLIGGTCALHRLLQNPKLPSIPQAQFHSCRSRLPLGVLALRSLAAVLELTLYLSLVVRRWCRAFLFDPLSMEENFAENVCQLVDVLRIVLKSKVWRSHPVSHQSSHWSPFRVGLANVPHLHKPAHIRCRDELFCEIGSASPVPPGFSVTWPLTNAANSDMKGCPIWCPCPFAASLYAFPCALAAAKCWNEATSPSTSHVRQRNSSSGRLDWTHCSRSSSR